MFGGMVLVSCNPVVCVWDIWRSTSVLASPGLPPRYPYVLKCLCLIRTLLIWSKTNGPGSSPCSVFDLQQRMPWRRRNWKVNKKTVPAPGWLFSAWTGVGWSSWCPISAGDHLMDPLVLQAWDLITSGLSVHAHIAVNITPAVLHNFVKLSNFITL